MLLLLTKCWTCLALDMPQNCERVKYLTVPDTKHVSDPTVVTRALCLAVLLLTDRHLSAGRFASQRQFLACSCWSTQIFDYSTELSYLFMVWFIRQTSYLCVYRTEWRDFLRIKQRCTRLQMWYDWETALKFAWSDWVKARETSAEGIRCLCSDSDR